MLVKGKSKIRDMLQNLTFKSKGQFTKFCKSEIVGETNLFGEKEIKQLIVRVIFHQQLNTKHHI